MTSWIIRLAAALCGLLLFVAAPAGAGALPRAQDAGPTVNSGKTRSQLIPAGDHVILHLSPDKGWHTYWTNPGDSGMATSVKLTLPAGLSQGETEWPTPDRIIYGPIANFGYSGDVYLPVAIKGDIAPGTVVKARADWLVCSDICIPEGADLSVTMGGGVSDNAALVKAIAPMMPQAAPGGAYEVKGEALRLRLAWPLDGAAKPHSVAVFPYEDGLIDNIKEAKWGVDGGSLVVELARGAKPMPDHFQAVVKLRDARDQGPGFKVDFSPGSVPAAALVTTAAGTASDEGGAVAPQIGFLQALLFAFVGGIILNLMPCVFPVLSIKAMALARSAGHDDRARRIEGLVYTAGVLVSFAVIAGLLLALRAGGTAIGWGFQLQSPVFVSVMAFILFVMGLSFSGLFSLGGGFTGVGQSLTEHKGHSGAFFTGALATLVATPCTAPFMAAALGPALVLPPLMGGSIFLMVGLGLATPILVISFVPAFGRLLPRPGLWMVTFRQFLSFLLYATVVWLLWVLGRQVGVDGLAMALMGLVLLGFMVWLISHYKGHSRINHVLRAGGALLALGLLVYATVSIAGLPQAGRSGSDESVHLAADAYTPQRLDELLGEGKPVFVNFTADWCITCLANEKVALSSAQVKAAFEKRGVTYLKGDWTSRDAQITKVLTRFGRSGVPLYLYYPAGVGAAGTPIVLPQLLTPGTIINVLNRKGPQRSAALSDKESKVETSYGG